MKLATVVIRSLVWTTGGQIATFGFTFAANLLLVRLVDAPLFGEIAVAASLVEILGFVASFAVNQAVLQHSDDGERAVAATVTLSLGLAAILACVGVVSCVLLRPLYGRLVVIFAAWLFASKALQLISAPYLTLYERNFDYRGLSLLRFATGTAATWAAVWLAWRGWGVESLVTSRFAADLLTFLFLAAVVMPRVGLVGLVRRADAAQLKRTLRFGLNLWSLRTLEQILYNVDVLVIGQLFPQARGFQIGCYSQAKYIAGLPNTFASGLSQTMSYRLYAAKKDQPDQLTRVSNIIARSLSRLLLPFTLTLIIYPDVVLRLLYGEKWLAAAPMLRVFGTYSLIVALYSNTRALLVAIERWADLYLIYALGIAAYAALALTPFNSDIYAACAIFMAALVVVLLTSWTSLAQGMRVDLRSILVAPALVTIATLGIWTLLRYVGPASLTQGNFLGLAVCMLLPTFLLLIADRRFLVEAGLAALRPERLDSPAVESVV